MLFNKKNKGKWVFISAMGNYILIESYYTILSYFFEFMYFFYKNYCNFKKNKILCIIDPSLQIFKF